MEINQAIKENRLLNHLTQKDLAGLLNVSDKTISSWETGRTYPDISLIIKLSEIFNISLDEFLKGDAEMVRKMDRDIRMKDIYKLILVIGTALIVGLVIFLNTYQNKNEWLDRINPFVETKIGYATLPKEVTYNNGKQYQEDSKERQYPDPYQDINVMDSPFGDSSLLTFQGGRAPNGRNYAMVKHKGAFVEKIAFIPWEAIPELYRVNMSKTYEKL